MAVIVLAGFESRLLATENIGFSAVLSGTAAISQTQARTGTSSLRCNPASGASGTLSNPGVGSGNPIVHFGLYIASLPSVARSILGNPAAGGLTLNTNGTLVVRDDSAATIGTSAALNTATWYWIGIRSAAAFTGVWLQIDGSGSVSSGSAKSCDVKQAALGCQGVEASAIDLFFDDYLLDDTNFLAPSKVDTALPISDNTVTGVTDNNGVTTNIWDCVDNTPPAGVASANEAANPKAGMHFPASVTENYLANLETYTTLGVASGDTVLAVQSIVRHGEDIATGTKNLQNVGALTNPTVGGASVTAGSDGGAHGAETGLWVTTLGTLTTSPSVTLGTSPTIRTSRTSETRVACLDFMGMLVAWTPAAAARSLVLPHRHRSLIVR